MNAAEDAQKISIPHIVLASKDEPAEEVARYTAILAQHGKGGHVETYDTMWHGWMGARADLEKDDGRTEYIRGYVIPIKGHPFVSRALANSHSPSGTTSWLTFSRNIYLKNQGMLDATR